MIIYCDQVSESRLQTYCEVCHRPWAILTTDQISQRMAGNRPVICVSCATEIASISLAEDNGNFLIARRDVRGLLRRSRENPVRIGGDDEEERNSPSEEFQNEPV